jgi:hypothetical protein
MNAAGLSHGRMLGFDAMRRSLALTLVLVAAACGGKKDPSSIYELSHDPISVRGWIVDVAGAQRGTTMETEIARRTQLFQSSSLWVENAQYASGGIAENGAFIVLDVPPQHAIVGINAPGAQNAQILLEGVPGNSDVFIPDLVLKPGGATVLDPSKIQIRLPAEVDKATPTGKTAKVAGYVVRIMNTPLAQLTDRRDYPSPPGYRPVATVR